MTKRTDIHRVSEIVPDDYEYLLSFAYSGSGGPGWNIALIRATVTGEATYKEPVFGGPYFTVIGYSTRTNPFGKLDYFNKEAHGSEDGGCDCCGAHFIYGDIWRHKSTGECIKIGHICADKYSLLTNRADLDRYRKGLKDGRAASRLRAKRHSALRDFVRRNKTLLRHLKTDHRITKEIRNKVIQHPEWKLSQKQRDLLVKLTAQVAERKQQDQEDAATATPVVTGNGVELSGVVLAVKFEDSHFAYGVSTLKMLLKDDRGFKVWGTVPAAIDDVQKGDRVSLVANVEARLGDEFFGFYKRPRKATLEPPPDYSPEELQAAYDLVVDNATAENGDAPSREGHELLIRITGHLLKRKSSIERGAA